VAGEPADCQFSHLFRCPWLLEQAGGTGNDGQLVLARQLLPGLAVQVEDGFIAAADDEQRGRPHRGELRPGQVGPAAAGDDRRDRHPRVGG